MSFTTITQSNGWFSVMVLKDVRVGDPSDAQEGLGKTTPL